MSSSTLIGLIVCNVIWSANPAMAKLVLSEMGAAHSAWLRTTSAFVSYLILMSFVRVFSKRQMAAREIFVTPKRAVDGLLLIAMGFFAFCFAPLMGMTGLSSSRAVDNSFIVAMEPLLTVFMAWVFLREKIQLFQLVSFAIALIGFSMLSGLSWSQAASGWDPHAVGNLILLVSIFGDGSYSIFGRKLARTYEPIHVFGTSLAFGFAALSVAVFLLKGIPDLGQLGWRGSLGLLWLGPLGTTASYIFWMVALKDSAVASVALTLFIQPLLGAVFGYLFLHERLTLIQFSGGVCILAAVIAQALTLGRAGRYWRWLRRQP